MFIQNRPNLTVERKLSNFSFLYMNVWRQAKEKARQASYFFTGKSETEKLVYEATNDDPWGPANTQMQEIARISNNWSELENIKKALWDRLGDTDEVRHVQKALLLLEYLLRNGNENIRNDSRMMLGQLQGLTTLQQYSTGENAALEAVIRKKAADIIQIINDNDLYQMEREKARKVNSALSSVSGGGGGFYNGYDNYSYDTSNAFDGYDDDLPSRKQQKQKSESEDEEMDFDPRTQSQIEPTPQTRQPFDPFENQQSMTQTQLNESYNPFGQKTQQLNESYNPLGQKTQQLNESYNPSGQNTKQQNET